MQGDNVNDLNQSVKLIFNTEEFPIDCSADEIISFWVYKGGNLLLDKNYW